MTVLIVSSEVELAVLRRKWRIVLRNNEYVEEVAEEDVDENVEDGLAGR